MGSQLKTIKMQKQLIYEINNINYLLVELPISSEHDRQKLIGRMKRHNAILQSGQPKKSFWSTYVMCNILVPETSILAFDREGLQ